MVSDIFERLPALYRERDAGALRAHVAVLARELDVVEDGVDQLYDDMFVETAQPWALPYLAGLIGLAGLPGETVPGLTSRAEVANRVACIRRKGTAAVLEQVARDTTGWPARAVEYFEHLVACQHVNHVRPRNQATAAVRSPSRMQYVDTPFERRADADITHTVDVRRIPSRRGRYNIGNVGIHLWRLRAHPVTDCPATPASDGDAHRFRVDPLGRDVQLFSLPVTESGIVHLAEPRNVPMPISRRLMADDPAAYVGPGLSLHIAGVDPGAVRVCDLSDDGAGWAHTPVPAGLVRVDPVLGRIAFGDPQDAPPAVTWHRGFSADLGGGEYNRVDTFATGAPTLTVAADGSADHATIAAALAVLPAGGGTVEVRDNARYDETLSISLAGGLVELRAADRRRPVVVLGADLDVALADDAELVLNGLVIAGGAVRVTGDGRCAVRHCTLVPDDAPGLVVDSGGVSATLQRTIVGGIRTHVDSLLACVDTVVDAREDGVALASAPDGSGPGGSASFDECTVLGRVHARALEMVSNSILLAVVPPGEEDRWPGPVLADRRQQGCARFSYIPAGSRTPRRYRCVPGVEADAAGLRPVFTSLDHTRPGYAQLDRRTPDAVRRGADDESEMGALHHLHQPQREAYLAARLADYLRFGLEVGLFFVT